MLRARNAGGRRGLLGSLLLAVIIPGLLLAGSPRVNGNGWLGSIAVARADVPARVPRRPALGPNQADVIISGQAQTQAIPRLFLGVSTEFTTLPLVERRPLRWGLVLNNLTNSGGTAPPQLALRIGGDSAEHVVYNKERIRFPPWAFKPTEKLVNDTVKAIDETKLQVIIDINTITSTPHDVGVFMKKLLNKFYRQVNHGDIVAFELGNEPDIYNQKAWEGGIGIRAVHHSAPKKPLPKLPRQITAKSFADTYLKYARALHSKVPKVPLMAPALSEATKNVGWIRTLLRRRHPWLREITAHVYPYSQCVKSGPKHPTIKKILSENATRGMVDTIRPALEFTHKHRLGFRLTEINSVTCGGTAKVSNTFATALWAPDAFFELMRAGVEGVNLHARVESINRPFSFDKQGQLQTRPLLYGLALFKRMLNWGDRLIPLRLRTGRSLHLKVWAVRASSSNEVEGTPFIPGHVLKVLVINKGRTSALIHLHLPTHSRGYVQRLLAPSASSTSGMTLEGEHLNHQGLWQYKQNTKGATVFPGLTGLKLLGPAPDGSYVLGVRYQSAALLTVPVAATMWAARPRPVAGPTPLFGYS